ncbi:ComEC/Rec2 family competence protein [Flavobacteriaceae bacterium M23B6Z8]
MKLLNYKLSYLVSAFILGIFAGFYASIPLKMIYTIFIFGIGMLIWLKIRADRRFLQKPGFTLLAYLIFFVLGTTTMTVQYDRNYESHYTNQIKEDHTHLVFLRITETLKSSKKFDRYLGELIQLDSVPASGKVLLNLQKDSTQKLHVDGIYVLKDRLQELRKPLNPGQFDYASYMAKKEIYHQIYTSSYSVILVSKSNSLLGMAHRIQQKLVEKLAIQNFGNQELAIMTALLLGDRAHISAETYADFSSAGVIHILAISGLHIGILLMILNFLLRPLHRFKNGRMYKSVLIILLLWIFALLTGLSPSVVRSVTMFSLFAYALNRKKITSTYNVLFASMFFLLLFNPLLIFDVGFQLSYAAVFAILWIQPLLYAKWQPQYKLIRYLWSLFTVTIAAQLGLLPLSFFYFHQFPGLFFISNLFIIPFLGFLLCAGIVVLILSVFNSLPDLFAEFYNNLLWLLHTFVSWVAQQESFIFKHIFFDTKMLIASYLLLFAFLLLISKRSKKRVFILSTSSVCLLCLISWNSYYQHKTDALIIFNQYRETIIAHHQGDTLRMYKNTQEASTESFLLKSYRNKYPYQMLVHNQIPKKIDHKNQQIIILDTLRKNIPSNSIILLRNSPKINLQRLIQESRPKVIIADGSNYPSFKKRWKHTCTKEKLPFHDTYEKGAYMLIR